MSNVRKTKRLIFMELEEQKRREGGTGRGGETGEQGSECASV